MKTRIPIKRYELDDELKQALEIILALNIVNKGPIFYYAKQIAKEYKKLEVHHKEEIEFLIKRIEELERDVDYLNKEIKHLVIKD